MLRWSTGEKKAGCSTRICSVPWKGHRELGETEAGLLQSWEDRTWRIGGRGDNLQLAYLLPWSERPEGSQEMPIGFRGWDKAMSCVRKVWKKDLCGGLGVVAERKGRLQVVCYSSRDEIRDLDLEEKRER